jgi:ATP-dependent DNA helicase RecG
MFSDECPLLQSRVFCTHWDGLDKSGGVDDAVDDKEFEGDIISQLMSSHDFIKMNSRVRWKKCPTTGSISLTMLTGLFLKFLPTP